VKLATVAVDSLGTVRLIESIRWTCGISEEHHRVHALFSKTHGYGPKQFTAETTTLDTFENVDFVQFPGIPRNAAVMRHTLGEANQFTAVVFNDKAEASRVYAVELVAPLLLTKFVGWSARDTVPMCFGERYDV